MLTLLDPDKPDPLALPRTTIIILPTNRTKRATGHVLLRMASEILASLTCNAVGGVGAAEGAFLITDIAVVALRIPVTSFVRCRFVAIDAGKGREAAIACHFPGDGGCKGWSGRAEDGDHSDRDDIEEARHGAILHLLTSVIRRSNAFKLIPYLVT